MTPSIRITPRYLCLLAVHQLGLPVPDYPPLDGWGFFSGRKRPERNTGEVRTPRELETRVRGHVSLPLFEFISGLALFH